MKKMVFVAVVILLFYCQPALTQSDCQSECRKEGLWSDPEIGKCVSCPKGKWFHPVTRKCVKPVNIAGWVDPKYRHLLHEECGGSCVDQWCCPEEKDYFRCMDFPRGKRLDCLINSGCFVYGE